ncbi:Alpha-glucan family phosphorylase [Sulfidibacter corallicola]|uniref:Alpha-glucan family phosphorylase n=1 Tax=Sulfidibacter corallicola TaxID=2818388 RepID=A0A8A4TNC0_SULCO|nr:alpha-glucan family phosphorylase [Sulfidibacter corallicola]QTD48085.1 alpha-glucan family phosphorylase [Sulfidibacter corallicola]
MISPPREPTDSYYVFEVCWELGEKSGSTRQVLLGKALKMSRIYGDHYYLIAPHPDQAEDAHIWFAPEPFEAKWLGGLAERGLRVLTGRWKVPGNPRCLLVDFSGAYRSKGEILEWLWHNYRVDSVNADWDYLEPVLFGYRAGQIIANFAEERARGRDVLAQWHNWHVGAGLLYLKQTRPEVAQVFTAHHTVLGRGIAGTGENLINSMEKIHTQERAAALGVMAKVSLEAACMTEADCLTAISAITATEIQVFHDLQPGLILPNALPDPFPNKDYLQPERRLAIRDELFRLTEAMTNQKLDRAKTSLVLTSGRYEYVNKGLNLILDSLPLMEESLEQSDRHMVLFLLMPCGAKAPKTELLNALNGVSPVSKPQLITHELSLPEDDPLLAHLERLDIRNEAADHIKVIFIPTQLDGSDAILPRHFLELIPAFDLSVYPSHYQSWGFSAMESLACGVPTITSDLSGFGNWIAESVQHPEACYVMPRAQADYEQATRDLAEHMLRGIGPAEPTQVEKRRSQAKEIADAIHWTVYIRYYLEAYHEAVLTRDRRFHGQGNTHPETIWEDRPTGHPLESQDHLRPIMKPFTVLNILPTSLTRLRELAYNLWWSWHPDAETLFRDLSPDVWFEASHNPVELLDSVPQETLDKAAQDPIFLDRLDRVLASFDAYQTQRRERMAKPEIAYFSYQFGIHECLPLYQNSSGITAGDYLKSASDLSAPVIAVGLAFHRGHYVQKFDLQGHPLHEPLESDFTSLPLRPLKREDGSLFLTTLVFPGRKVTVQIWLVQVGAVSLYLLDTDHPDNHERDRHITRDCNPSDNELRLQQYMILGIGGCNLIRELGFAPQVWHLNDCSGALAALSRAAYLIHHTNLDFEAAWEFVRQSTLVTLHQAGKHPDLDSGAFDEDTMRPYFSIYRHALDTSWSQIMALGAWPESSRPEPLGQVSAPPDGARSKAQRSEPGHHHFSMTLLAIRASGTVVAKSQTHRESLRHRLQTIAPGFHYSELPITCVTEGIHAASWLADPIQKLLSRNIGEHWRSETDTTPDWNSLREIPDKDLRRIRQELKSKLVHDVRRHLEHTWHKRRDSPSLLTKIIGNMREDALIIGFSHDFTPHSRANLLFRDPATLARIVNLEDRPVMVFFTDKIQPGDTFGEKLLENAYRLCREEEFLGKLIFLEDYGIAMAKRLVQGCDLWLNAPVVPASATGLSGIKAALNGALNLSIPAGWWVEGDNGENGWTIGKNLQNESQDYQDEFDSQHLYLLLEQTVIPAYFKDCLVGPSASWLTKSKESMIAAISHFTSSRVGHEYRQRYYLPIQERFRQLSELEYAATRSLAAEKARIDKAWPHTRIVEARVEVLREESVCHGQKVPILVEVHHPDLPPEALRVEFVSARRDHDGQFHELVVMPLALTERTECSSRWKGTYVPTRNGLKAYGIRVVPSSEGIDLSHPLVKWAP